MRTFRLSGHKKTAPRNRGRLVVFGAGKRNRTSDLLITNQLLYRLSYSGVTGRASYGIVTGTGKPREITQHAAAGFTLLELVVVLVLAAILVALAVPSFRTMTQDSRRDAAVQDLVADLAFARSEALRRNTKVTLCRSSDGSACATGSGGYEIGWIVFPDGPPTGTHATDGSEPVLRQHGAIDDITVTGNGTNTNIITFNPNLRLTGNGGASSVGTTIKFCDAHRPVTTARAIIVSSVGRIRTGQDSDNNGIVEGGSGDLTCP